MTILKEYFVSNITGMCVIPKGVLRRGIRSIFVNIKRQGRIKEVKILITFI